MNQIIISLNPLRIIQNQGGHPDENTDFYDHVNTIYLLCDSYPVHFCPAALKFAKILNIDLIKIPDITTDIFQLLDCMVFGALKNRARTFFNTKAALEIMDLFDIDELLHATVSTPITPIEKQECTVVLDIYWNELPEDLAQVVILYAIFSNFLNYCYTYNRIIFDGSSWLKIRIYRFVASFAISFLMKVPKVLVFI